MAVLSDAYVDLSLFSCNKPYSTHARWNQRTLRRNTLAQILCLCTLPHLATFLIVHYLVHPSTLFASQNFMKQLVVNLWKLWVTFHVILVRHKYTVIWIFYFELQELNLSGFSVQSGTSCHAVVKCTSTLIAE